MDPIAIIQKYYLKDSKLYTILVEHSLAVAKKAVEIAKNNPQYSPDIQFIEEAAMLHDIGIFLTKAPSIHCFGEHSYVYHGILGRELLEKEGLPKHALVCERHTGFSVQDIQDQKLLLPQREMMPVTVEEEIIAFADRFFSKDEKNLSKEKSKENIKERISIYGPHKVEKFNEWCTKFG